MIKKSDQALCPKNIQLNLLCFLYDLPYNKRAKFCNKSHGNHGPEFSLMKIIGMK